jgi:hypothetical protein
MEGEIVDGVLRGVSWRKVRAVLSEHGIDASKASDEQLMQVLCVELPRLIGEFYAVWATTLRGAVRVVQENICSLVPLIEGFTESVTTMPSPREMNPDREEMS